MNYIEVRLKFIPMSEDYADIMAAMLAPFGYDSFTTEAEGLNAYCPVSEFSTEALQSCIAVFPDQSVGITFDYSEIETQDWNAQWESENAVEPVQFGSQTITIHPHMSFGSGHHETTSQLLDEILSLSLDGCSVLDMGTGTGVLAIAAVMHGAANARAIEIDDWVAENARDNVLINDLAGKVVVECGDASLLGNGQRYDLVLANINRNVLLADMHAYVADMNEGATLLMSGFYEEDVPLIRDMAESLGLIYQHHRSVNNWVVISFRR